MNSQSKKNAPLHSRMGLTLILLTVFLSIFILGGLTLLVVSLSHPEVMPLIVGGIFLIFPGLVLTGLWSSFFKIRIEGGRVSASSIFRNEVFFLDRVGGYALTYTPVKGRGEMETLHIGLPDGRLLTLNPQYYRNYGELRDALTQGKLPDPKVLARAIKLQKWQQFVLFSCIFGAGLVMIGWVATSPQLQAESGNDKLMVALSLIGGLLFLGWRYLEYRKAPEE